MFGYTLSNLAVGGPQAVGRAVNITARQTAFTGFFVSWDREATTDEDTVFLVYVDGRLAQRLSGATTSTTLIASDYDAHDVQVLAFPAHFSAPSENYGAAASTRAHLFWTRPADTSITSYKIYRSTTSTGTYTLVDTLSTPVVENETIAIGSGTLTIAGGPESTTYTNATFTLTITDAAARTATITNNVDATSIAFTYSPGLQASPIAGITFTLSATLATSDSATFLIAIPNYYDSAPLAEGTYYFKVLSFDAAGNPEDTATALAAQTPAAVTITPPPEPVTSFSVAYDESTGALTYAATQSPTASATEIYIYSNWDGTTLHPAVTFDSDLLTVAATASQAVSGTLVASPTVDGVYRFVARAVTSAGVDDQTASEETVTLPYVPADLPTIAFLTATPAAGGDVTLTWAADGIPVSGWRVTGFTVTPLTVSPTASAASTLPRDDDDDAAAPDLFLFTATVDALNVGAAGTYTATVAALSSGGFTGTPASATVTSDATAPTAVTTLGGVAF